MKTKMKTTHPRVHSQMRAHRYLVAALGTRTRLPTLRRLTPLGLRVRRKLKIGEVLKETNEEKRDFLIRELLPDAYSWTGVEGKEDVRIRRKVSGHPFVEEA